MLEKGWEYLERETGVENLANAEELDWQHVLHNALLAHGAYELDVDYIVRDDKVVVGNSVMITFSFDHRYADGAHGSHLMRRFKKLFADPHAYKHLFEEASEDG